MSTRTNTKYVASFEMTLAKVNGEFVGPEHRDWDTTPYIKEFTLDATNEQEAMEELDDKYNVEWDRETMYEDVDELEYRVVFLGVYRVDTVEKATQKVTQIVEGSDYA